MGRRSAVGGFAVAAAVGWNTANIGAVADDLAADYAVALATVGLFTTVMFVVHTAMQLPGGRAIDRLGPRAAALTGLALIGGANVLGLADDAVWLALLCRAVIGVGTGLAYVAGSDLARASSPSPLVQGVFGGMTGASGGLALALVPQLERWLGFRAPWASAAVAAGAALLVVATVRRPPRLAPHELAGVRGLLHDGRLYRIAVPYTAALACGAVTGHWAVTLLERAGGLGRGSAGVVGGLTLAGAVVSRPVGGWVMRRHPRRLRRALAASLVAGGAGTALFAVASPLAVAVPGGILVGLASGIPFAVGFAAAARLRPDAPGTAVSLVNMFGNLGIVVGIPLVGLAFSLPGEDRIGFLVIAAIWAAAALAVPSNRVLGVESG